MSYADFVSDVLGLQEALLTEAQRAEARAAFAAWDKQTDARKNWKAGKKVLADRAVAGLFGGKALTGSAKQKVWAEKIRAGKLHGEKVGFGCYAQKDEMTDAQAVLACDPNGLGKSAHFWIANRARRPSEIGAFFEQQKRLLADALALRDAGKTEEFKAASAEYNALTTAWGFTQ